MDKFIVGKDQYDAARPYYVKATFRRFNQIIGRYATAKQARECARRKNAAG